MSQFFKMYTYIFNTLPKMMNSICQLANNMSCLKTLQTQLVDANRDANKRRVTRIALTIFLIIRLMICKKTIY